MYSIQVDKMSHGGKRSNSGPKKSVSAYGEPTFPIRMPISVQSKVVTFLDEFKKHRTLTLNKPLDTFPLAALNPPSLELPLYIGKVSAGRTTGFASPAQDYEQEKLDLNKKLITNAPATFFYTVGKSDDSMIDEGIMPGAMLIVDRSKERRSGRNVIAIVDDEYVVKRLYVRNGVYELRSMNKVMNYPPISFKDGSRLIVKGVVTHVVNSF
jgi:DNA polymerase V